MRGTVESGHAQKYFPHTQSSRGKEGERERHRERETERDGEETAFRKPLSGGIAKETKSLAQKQTNKASLSNYMMVGFNLGRTVVAGGFFLGDIKGLNQT